MAYFLFGVWFLSVGRGVFLIEGGSFWSGIRGFRVEFGWFWGVDGVIFWSGKGCFRVEVGWAWDLSG